MSAKRTARYGSPNVSYRLGAMAEDVRARAGHGMTDSAVAQRDLERYYATLKASLLDVELSEQEACLIVDACNGLLVEPHTVGLLWAQIDDAIRLDGLDRKWGVDGPALVEKIRRWTYAENLAVQDAAERAWNMVSAGTAPEDCGEWMRTVGLVRDGRK